MSLPHWGIGATADKWLICHSKITVYCFASCIVVCTVGQDQRGPPSQMYTQKCPVTNVCQCQKCRTNNNVCTPSYTKQSLQPSLNYSLYSACVSFVCVCFRHWWVWDSWDVHERPLCEHRGVFPLWVYGRDGSGPRWTCLCWWVTIRHTLKFSWTLFIWHYMVHEIQCWYLWCNRMA